MPKNVTACPHDNYCELWAWLWGACLQKHTAADIEAGQQEAGAEAVVPLPFILVFIFVFLFQCVAESGKPANAEAELRVCVFLLYISLMNTPITNLNQMSKR